MRADAQQRARAVPGFGEPERSARLHAQTRGALRALVLAAILFAVPPSGWPAQADEAEFRKDIAGFTIYLAVMPAAIVQGPAPAEVAGASPFRSAPAARDTHHVMVSLFESSSGRRVSDARVAARVARLGFSGEKRRLEATRVAGASVYGATFPMLGRGPFRVDVEFSVPETTGMQRARFYFTQPSFAPPPGEK